MTYEEECQEIARKFALMFSQCPANPDSTSHAFCYETAKCVYCGGEFPYGAGKGESVESGA